MAADTDCSYEACHRRDGFFDVTDYAPEPYSAGRWYVIPFRCPEHGTVYEYQYELQHIEDAATGEIVHEY